MACDSAVQAQGLQAAANKGNHLTRVGEWGALTQALWPGNGTTTQRALPFGDQTSSLDIRYLTWQEVHLVMCIII